MNLSAEAMKRDSSVSLGPLCCQPFFRPLGYCSFSSSNRLSLSNWQKSLKSQTAVLTHPPCGAGARPGDEAGGATLFKTDGAAPPAFMSLWGSLKWTLYCYCVALAPRLPKIRLAFSLQQEPLTTPHAHVYPSGLVAGVMEVGAQSLAEIRGCLTQKSLPSVSSVSLFFQAFSNQSKSLLSFSDFCGFIRSS